MWEKPDPAENQALEGTRYPTGLTDEQWALIRPLPPEAKLGGRPRSVDLRAVLDGIVHVVHGGVSWRMRRHDLPPWGTVHYDYGRWRLDGTWVRIADFTRPPSGIPSRTRS